jgi:alanine dehydrogenase
MPGAVPRTSTFALNNATLPYTQALADKGARDAARADPGLDAGFNTYGGSCTCGPVADSQGREHHELRDLLAQHQA